MKQAFTSKGHSKMNEFKLTNTRAGHRILYIFFFARGVMVIVVGNGHGDTSSNPGREWLHFT